MCIYIFLSSLNHYKLHGAHVLIGTLFIYVQYIRITNYHMTNGHHLGLELSILYWHFVDVVWLFLFCVVYYWGGTGGSV